MCVRAGACGRAVLNLASCCVSFDVWWRGVAWLHRPGQEHRILVTIQNKSDAVRDLLAITFLNDTTEELFAVDGCTFPHRLMPPKEAGQPAGGGGGGDDGGDDGSVLILTLSFRPTRPGVVCNIIEFAFDGFSIGRYVVIESGDTSLHEALKPNGVYVRKKHAQKELTNVQKPATSGERTMGTSVRWQRFCDGHPVPATFADEMDVWADRLVGAGINTSGTYAATDPHGTAPLHRAEMAALL